jgi:hypothetical protein
MMKADVGAPVERDRLVRRLDPPQGDNQSAVRDEYRGIFRPLANDAPPQAIVEEAAGALEISDAQTDVIDAACGGCGVLCHGILLWCGGIFLEVAFRCGADPTWYPNRFSTSPGLCKPRSNNVLILLWAAGR